jgi:2-haloalkanoic acid dehalogenase type II
MRLSDFAAMSFDCYGTIIDWERGILAALQPWRARHGLQIGDAALFEAFGRAEAERQTAQPTALYPEILGGVLRDIGRELGAPVSDAEATAFGASIKDWPPFPDSIESLAYLKQHYKLVIVSNVDRESFRHTNARLGIAFDAIITAQDSGAYKPAHNHFRLAFARLAELGIGREKLLHVAQSLFHDHVPAKQLGLASVWINRRGEPDTAGAGAPVKPDWELPSLAALVELHRTGG